MFGIMAIFADQLLKLATGSSKMRHYSRSRLQLRPNNGEISQKRQIWI